MGNFAVLRRHRLFHSMNHLTFSHKNFVDGQARKPCSKLNPQEVLCPAAKLLSHGFSTRANTHNLCGKSASKNTIRRMKFSADLGAIVNPLLVLLLLAWIQLSRAKRLNTMDPDSPEAYQMAEYAEITMSEDGDVVNRVSKVRLVFWNEVDAGKAYTLGYLTRPTVCRYPVRGEIERCTMTDPTPNRDCLAVVTQPYIGSKGNIWTVDHYECGPPFRLDEHQKRNAEFFEDAQNGTTSRASNNVSLGNQVR
ncbi:uncharacterized protein [Dermacentor andersoni]|uniref:uncharacterized protein n=1 Tax=Dermacentor andersoni TaxID=34620 RepID=UPI002415B742|nr:uncharacterized protein LOC126534050 [Dermacentor andersoni]